MTYEERAIIHCDACQRQIHEKEEQYRIDLTIYKKKTSMYTSKRFDCCVDCRTTFKGTFIGDTIKKYRWIGHNALN